MTEDAAVDDLLESVDVPPLAEAGVSAPVGIAVGMEKGAAVTAAPCV